MRANNGNKNNERLNKKEKMIDEYVLYTEQAGINRPYLLVAPLCLSQPATRVNEASAGVTVGNKSNENGGKRREGGEGSRVQEVGFQECRAWRYLCWCCIMIIVTPSSRK